MASRRERNGSRQVPNEAVIPACFSPSINHVPYAYQWPMTDNSNPFADLTLERAIALRWTLRDIKAKRTKLSPVGEGDLRALMELGLVEMRDDGPVLTNAGHAVLD
jgi:hypothetical protein